jgi:hypothetical protein
MWQFNWGVFWAVLVALFLAVGFLSYQLEALNRCLLDIESRLRDVKDAIRPSARIGD